MESFLLITVETFPLPGADQFGLKGPSIGPAQRAPQRWLVARLQNQHPLEPEVIRFVGMGHRRLRDGGGGEYFYTVRGDLPPEGTLAVWPQGVALATAVLRVTRCDPTSLEGPCPVKLLGHASEHVGMLCPVGSTHLLLVPGINDRALQATLGDADRMVTRRGEVIPAEAFCLVVRPAHTYRVQSLSRPVGGWTVAPEARAIRRVQVTTTVHP